jgi:phenylpyruvate tautomerase PptA (4-oxalocrotonate tautomerase family)
MPLVTITVQGKKPTEFKSKTFAAVHAALVEIGVNQRDRFLRMIELDESSFEFDPTFPDAATPRTSDFMLIEILLGSGRSVKIKRQLVQGITQRLASAGFDPEHVMVCLQDVPWENWSPAGGRQLHLTSSDGS